MGWDTIDRYMILSSDAHAGAAMQDYRPYLEARWHDEFDQWLATVRNPWVDLRDPDLAERNWDSAARVAAMDADGVTGEVIFPNTLPPFFDILAHLSGVPRTRDEYDARWAGLRAHNRWLVDFCGEEPLRRRGVAQLLPNDIDDAVSEMHAMRESGVIGGVMLPAIPPNHTVEPYFHPRYDPLWATSAALHLPIHQHQGTGSPDVGAGLAVGRSIFFTELDLWTRRTMLHLIVGGVFERHPQLRVVWTEMWGLRWAVDDLAHLTRRLRNVQSRFAADPSILNYSQTFGSETTDSLSLTPIEYFRRNCYIGASMLPRHEVRFRHVLGVDRIMWGSDFPHDEGTAPHTSEGLRATLFDVPLDECRTMLAGVAADVYGFDLDALAPIAARVGPPVDLVHTPLDAMPAYRGEAFSLEDPLEAALSL